MSFIFRMTDVKMGSRSQNTSSWVVWSCSCAYLFENNRRRLCDGPVLTAVSDGGARGGSPFWQLVGSVGIGLLATTRAAKERSPHTTQQYWPLAISQNFKRKKVNAHSNFTRLVTRVFTRLWCCNGYKGHYKGHYKGGTLVMPGAITRLVMKFIKLDFAPSKASLCCSWVQSDEEREIYTVEDGC